MVGRVPQPFARTGAQTFIKKENVLRGRARNDSSRFVLHQARALGLQGVTDEEGRVASGRRLLPYPCFSMQFALFERMRNAIPPQALFRLYHRIAAAIPQ